MWREIRVDGLLRHKAQSIVLDGVMRVNGFGKTRDDPEDKLKSLEHKATVVARGTV